MPTDRFSAGQIVTVFRTRLRPEHTEAYDDDAARILALAETMPGFVEIKGFTAGDGERLSVVTFADQASHDDWRHHLDHVAAQQRGRSDYYSEYTLQVCSTLRVSEYGAGAGPG